MSAMLVPLILAQREERGEADLTQWYVGLAIFFLIVVVVVIIVATILMLASRIARQAQQGTRALHAARMSTLPAWELQTTNQTALAILDAARDARRELEARWPQRRR